MNIAVIGLGSNIDPEKNIESARQLIRSQFHVLKESRFLTTPPMGNPNQAAFMNGALLIETELSQADLKAILKDFEERLGRTAVMVCNNPRTIDFDIHIWNGKVVDSYFYQWEFVRTLVFELIPDLNLENLKF